MKRLNKLAAVFCVAAMALTAMTGCEGSDMFSVNSPDWLSEKIDSIEKANQSTEEVLVGMNEDVYTVGNTDFSSAFWTSFSKVLCGSRQPEVECRVQSEHQSFCN